MNALNHATESRTDAPFSDENFWGTIKEHEALIKRCFFFLFKKYPNHDGVDEAFNILLVQMHRMRTFQAFDPSRVKSANKAKAFEQFIYQRIEKILGDTYRSRVKRNERFTASENIEEITPKTYDARFHSNDSSFAKPEDFDKEGQVKEPVRKNYPSINDIAEYVGYKGFGVLDRIEATDLSDKLRKILVSERERKVFGFREEDNLSVIDIAEIMRCTPQNISLILKSIRERALKQGIIEAAKKRSVQATSSDDEGDDE